MYVGRPERLHASFAMSDGPPSTDSRNTSCTPISSSPCENSCREWRQVESSNCRLASLSTTGVLHRLVHEIEINYDSLPNKHSLIRLPPAEGTHRSNLRPGSNDLQSLSTKITRIMGFAAHHQLELPTSPVLWTLTAKQSHSETQNEIERQWREIWPEITQASNIKSEGPVSGGVEGGSG